MRSCGSVRLYPNAWVQTVNAIHFKLSKCITGDQSMCNTEWEVELIRCFHISAKGLLKVACSTPCAGVDLTINTQMYLATNLTIKTMCNIFNLTLTYFYIGSGAFRCYQFDPHMIPQR